jgi:hypothetical protein
MNKNSICHKQTLAPMWPLTTEAARLLFLTSVCAVAEGACGSVAPDADALSVAVAAVLLDAQGRLTRLGSRPGQARSVASVLCANVAWFLGGVLHGAPRARHFTKAPTARLAASADGRTLLHLASAWSGATTLGIHDDASGCTQLIQNYCSFHEFAISDTGDIFELYENYGVAVWGITTGFDTLRIGRYIARNRANKATKLAVHGTTAAINRRLFSADSGGVRFIDSATDVATDYFETGAYYEALSFTCDGALLAARESRCVRLMSVGTGVIHRTVALDLTPPQWDCAMVVSAFHEFVFAYAERDTGRFVLHAVLADGTRARVPPHVRSVQAGIALGASKLYIAGAPDGAYWPDHVAVYDV